MDYLIVFAFLLIAINIYFRIADRYNIIDKPNERSSHTTITIRGGGVIFFLALAAYFFSSGFQIPYFLVACTAVAIISFLDDIYTLSSKIRLPIQFVAMGLLFFELSLHEFPLWTIPIALIVSVGLINAYNFMDGINGITALYSIVVFGTLLVIHFLGLYEIEHWQMLVYVTLSLVVFAFYNVRFRAKCFAGDIGSVTIAFILLFYLLSMIYKSLNPSLILVLAVYGVDSILTIVHRLILKENIFEPHRKHLYQYLVHTAKWKHVNVSVLFALIQLFISAILVLNLQMNFVSHWFLTVSTILVISIIYIIVKRKLIRTNNE